MGAGEQLPAENEMPVGRFNPVSVHVMTDAAIGAVQDAVVSVIAAVGDPPLAST